MNVTAYDLAQRFVGTREIAGEMHNPAIMAMLKLDNEWPENDEVPWCSAFVNYIAWLLRLPRSKSLRARSWLHVGRPIDLHQATPDNDVVILQRGTGRQPGPEVLEAPGHVAFYSKWEDGRLWLLGGNQRDQVSVALYMNPVLGVRRLWP